MAACRTLANMSMAVSTPARIVRQFRQIVVWPVQLMPIKAGAPIQRHWEALDRIQVKQPLAALARKFDIGAEEFQERHYKEFVTFLPFVQRFLYGSPAGQESAQHAAVAASASIVAATSRACAADLRGRRSSMSSRSTAVDLYFFHDADVLIVVLEVMRRRSAARARAGRAVPLRPRLPGVLGRRRPARQLHAARRMARRARRRARRVRL